MGARFFAPFLLTMPEVVHALVLIADMEQGTHTLDVRGQARTITVRPFGPSEVMAPDTDTSWELAAGWVDARESARSPAALWLLSG
jgi:hypothetical protein